MALTITSFRVDYRESESVSHWPPVPYAIVNCTFKCSRDDDSDTYNYAWSVAKAESEEFKNTLTIDDPERYNAWLMSPDGWHFSSKYDGYGHAWIHNEQPWFYLEKFDTFWLREWVADCGPTRAIIHELEYFKEHGSLPSVYRSIDECIILSHLETLQRYWD